MKKPLKNITIVLGVLLLLAIFPLTYGYYTFLKLAVFVGGSFLAYQFYQQKNAGWAVVLASMAILFNPIIPVYLTREAWLPIDLLCGGLLFYKSFALKGINNE